MEELSPTFGNGKICYIEIPAGDVTVSSAFYKEVFGWNIRRGDDGSVSFDDGVNQVSGVWVLDKKPATDASLVVHIMVSDMDITLKLIEENNGKVVQASGKDLQEKTASFRDPFGNILGLYQHIT